MSIWMVHIRSVVRSSGAVLDHEFPLDAGSADEVIGLLEDSAPEGEEWLVHVEEAAGRSLAEDASFL